MLRKAESYKSLPATLVAKQRFGAMLHYRLFSICSGNLSWCSKAGATLAGGVEDPTHLGTLASQFVVLSNSLLSLQNSDFNTLLLHKVQSGGGNLSEQMTAQTDLVHLYTEAILATSISHTQNGSEFSILYFNQCLHSPLNGSLYVIQRVFLRFLIFYVH